MNELAVPDSEDGEAIDERPIHGVCDGTGEPPVKRKGKLTCPGCGVEVPDFVYRIPAKKHSEETM